MKILSKKSALARLHKLKTDYAAEIREKFEHKAKSCLGCDTKGECCTDAHFVNVHITRLEATAINEVLSELPAKHREKVYQRIDDVIEKYNLSAGEDSFARTFACPLFEAETGCLVHQMGKPLPCIQHACYENKVDLPPDALLAEQEKIVDYLNRRTYGILLSRWAPLPIAIKSEL